ncbi:MAG: hypothetical protein Q9M18_01340 [Mariprofundaceae bacterium]|nr:hypothetical protein [Mariprofundaceae bacterium]
MKGYLHYYDAYTLIILVFSILTPTYSIGCDILDVKNKVFKEGSVFFSAPLSINDIEEGKTVTIMIFGEYKTFEYKFIKDAWETFSKEIKGGDCIYYFRHLEYSPFYPKKTNFLGSSGRAGFLLIRSDKIIYYVLVEHWE